VTKVQYNCKSKTEGDSTTRRRKLCRKPTQWPEIKNLHLLSQDKTWLKAAFKYNRLTLHEHTYGPLNTIKHNPTNDKRYGLAKSHLKAHIISTHCKDILWKDKNIQIQTEKRHPLLSSEKSRPSPESARARHKPYLETPSSTQPPRTTTNCHKPGLRSKAYPSCANLGNKFPSAWGHTPIRK
jgi:hypothetical protein